MRTKSEQEKTTGYRRIAYQISEQGSEACGRSFEDAFILANRDSFDDLQGNNEVDVENSAYGLANTIVKGSKANFAIKYSIDETEWRVPKYIVDGLILFFYAKINCINLISTLIYK